MIGFLVIAHAVESVLGFGATVIAFGLGAHFFPADRLVVILVLIALVQSAYLMARWFRDIEWGIVFRSIAPAALMGLAAGILIRSMVNEGMLKLILGGFIVTLSLIELRFLFLKKDAPPRDPSAVTGSLLVFGGGVFHGLLAVGGPLIVYYAGRKLASQESVRGTLAFIWIFLNTIMLAGFIADGSITADVLSTAGLLLPGVLAGILIGNRLKISDRLFKTATYLLLLVVGATLVLP
ncbi:MAG: sulfite exporter TauE/SafE family protein [Syntrophales bacterium]|nr:sulfite exporter TauE/SafE family protein [Syntrophales bacterium]MDD4338884.1 sulfite exporter TauE/SafE family protein [Syntrophales bacterium]HOG08360.1 sulfite exporter TauE/SafE family protein [Syntrophales bacterium]HPB69610.1 sulfite exporter TauE/SafE family protein [Syntrophales bacterium]HQN25422.1 sulfite exporter TauE/SafE family protein [Syntrophales bacterium]